MSTAVIEREAELITFLSQADRARLAEQENVVAQALHKVLEHSFRTCKKPPCANLVRSWGIVVRTLAPIHSKRRQL